MASSSLSMRVISTTGVYVWYHPEYLENEAFPVKTDETSRNTHLHMIILLFQGHVRRQKKIVPHRRKIVPRKRLAVTGVCIVVRRQKKRSYPEIHTPHHQPHLAVPSQRDD